VHLNRFNAIFKAKPIKKPHSGLKGLGITVIIELEKHYFMGIFVID